MIKPAIPFRLRIRKSDRISDGKKRLRASTIFAHLKPGQTQVISNPRWVWGRSVYVSALRLDDGELLIVISSDSTTTAISEHTTLDIKHRKTKNFFTIRFKISGAIAIQF